MADAPDDRADRLAKAERDLNEAKARYRQETADMRPRVPLGVPHGQNVPRTIPSAPVSGPGGLVKAPTDV